ncbi:MAG: hypothetical protein JNK65_05955 [Deltaproteobacteria bacterium]|nr:hypothetical protein [Deltaproteobacteria bacterium]
MKHSKYILFIIWMLFSVFLVPSVLHAQTPSNRNVFSENTGWWNALDEVSGVRVQSEELLGFFWSENLGWINLSCKNRNTCQSVDYGIKKDPQGNVSGFAWGENIGWIQFKGEMYGVRIDSQGIWRGKAWSENVGWINFDGENNFSLKSTMDTEGTPQQISAQKEGAVDSKVEERSSSSSCQLNKNASFYSYPVYYLLAFGALFLLFVKRID